MPGNAQHGICPVTTGVRLITPGIYLIEASTRVAVWRKLSSKVSFDHLRYYMIVEVHSASVGYMLAWRARPRGPTPIARQVDLANN
jgi:hypothetical protein